MEIVVALAIMGLAGALFAMAFKALTRGGADIAGTVDMQRVVKDMGTQLESDLKRAGFGLAGGAVFTTLGTREVAFRYKDLLGTSCPAGGIASVRYTLEANALVRDLACDGASRQRKATGAGLDSLSLSFRYLDDAGHPAATTATVRTVEFSVQLVSGRGTREGRKTRVSAGSVSMVNNG